MPRKLTPEQQERRKTRLARRLEGQEAHPVRNFSVILADEELNVLEDYADANGYGDRQLGAAVEELVRSALATWQEERL